MLKREIIARGLDLKGIGFNEEIIYGDRKNANDLYCICDSDDDRCGTGDDLLDLILGIDTSDCRNDDNYYDDDDDSDDSYNNYYDEEEDG